MVFVTSRRAAVLVAAVVAVPICAIVARRQMLARSRRRLRSRICRLLRYPVKGLDFTAQPLRHAKLEVGGSLPDDRRWALQKGNADPGLGDFNPQKPLWVHKMRFAASCSEGPALGSLRADWRDEDSALALYAKGQGGPLLLSPTSLLGSDTLQIAEAFLRQRLSDPGLKIVTSAGRRNHQFANTKPLAGMEGMLTLHIVNLATVQALSKAAGVEVDWRRFRPNILLDSGVELPAWSEFKWVGHCIRAGGARLRVTKRTVRCGATKTNPESAKDDLDVPALLQRHFPEHGPYLGVYAVVEQGGEINDGDFVEGLW